MVLTLEQRFIWSGDSMVYACELLYPNNGTVYVYGINLISLRNSSGVETFYLYNAHGDVVQLVDGNGTITKTYNYDAFGVEYEVDGEDDNSFRYAGQHFDTETGTYYLRARYYNPPIGRFTQQDTWEYIKQNDPLSLNLYNYCRNNPVLFIDINGHWPSWGQVFQTATIVLGATLAVTAILATAGGAALMVGAVAGSYAVAAGATAATAAAITTVATTAATVGAYAVAGGIAATALSDVGEVFTGHNVNRDDLMGGNQEAYDTLKIGLNVVGAGIVELGANYNANSAPSAKADEGAPKTQVTINNDIIGKPRGGSALKLDKYHGFNDIVDNYAGAATKTGLNNGATLFQVEGSLNGVVGRF